jgi:hypothetical protein
LKVLQPWSQNNELINAFVQVESEKCGDGYKALIRNRYIMSMLGDSPNYDLAYKLA